MRQTAPPPPWRAAPRRHGPSRRPTDPRARPAPAAAATDAGDSAAANSAAVLGPVAAALAAALSPKNTIAAAAPAGDVNAITAATAAPLPAATAPVTADSGDKHSQAGEGGAGTPDGSVSAAQAAVNSQAAATLPANLQKIDAPVGSAAFSQGIAERVSYLVDKNMSSATLQVTPPQLGPIDIRIDVQNGHAQVWMSANSAVTRDALASSATQLREMLGSQGFGQVSVDISQRSFQDRPAFAQTYDWSSPSGDRAQVSAPAATVARSGGSGLDAYA